MARRKKIGMKTGDMVLFGGVGLLAVYLLTKKPTTTPYYPPTGYPPYTGYPVQSNPGNSTSSIISASGSALGDIISSIFG